MKQDYFKDRVSRREVDKHLKGHEMEGQASPENTELLEEITLFQDLDESERAICASIMVDQDYASNDEIFREGDSGGQLYVIKEGSVEVQKSRSYGAGRIVIARFERGGVIGEMSLIDRMPRSASVVAVEDTRVMLLTQDALAGLISEHPQVAIKFLKGLAKLLSMRLRNTSGWFADVF